MRFALIGVGYIAPRHLRAIKETGNELVAALDPHDSVGVLDQYFPNAAFFTEFERFDRHLEKLRRNGEGVDYVSICSPNYLHDAHIRAALRLGANAICEKPLVVKPHNLEALQIMEEETGRRVNTILQLRYHPAIVSLKQRIGSGIHRVRLNYCTPRGKWYHVSWKGQPEKSGGLVMNIGVHLLDMLLWVFGPSEHSELTQDTPETISGRLMLKHADVDWTLSVKQGERKRLMTVDGEVVDFTTGFDDLHTVVYNDILSGGGYGIADSYPAIRLAHSLRGMR